MEQIGPSTHEFAEARKLSRTVGDEMMKELMERTNGSEPDVRGAVIRLGLVSLEAMRKRSMEMMNEDPRSADLLLEMVMLGFGWSAMATHYELTIPYVKMLDELNGMKVQGDNDLPSTENKG